MWYWWIIVIAAILVAFVLGGMFFLTSVLAILLPGAAMWDDPKNGFIKRTWYRLVLKSVGG